MNQLSDIASRVGTPLALAGVIASILLYALITLLRKDIFPQLAKVHGYQLLTLLLNKLFQLALMAVLLGFVAFIFPTALQALRSDPRKNADELFRVLENTEAPSQTRLQALQILRDELGVRDFRKRNLSRLALPPSGWQNADLTEANLQGVTLRNANLRGIQLVRANMVGADVSGSDFRDGALNGSDLSDGNCTGALFSEVWLRFGRYRGANFTGARLNAANLESADFERAVFDDADFSRARSAEANFVGADLRKAQNLATAYLDGATYDGSTTFPPGFLPAKNSMKQRR